MSHSHIARERTVLSQLCARTDRSFKVEVVRSKDAEEEPEQEHGAVRLDLTRAQRRAVERQVLPVQRARLRHAWQHGAMRPQHTASISRRATGRRGSRGASGSLHLLRAAAARARGHSSGFIDLYSYHKAFA